MNNGMMTALVAAEVMVSPAPKAKELTPEQQEGKEKTIAYVAELEKGGTRITYARFGEVAQENGWIGESKISLGQRGAQLVKHLPSELQYAVCQASGRYSKKAKEAFMAYLPEVERSPEEVLKLLRYVPAEGPGGETFTFERKRRGKKSE